MFAPCTAAACSAGRVATCRFGPRASGASDRELAILDGKGWGRRPVKVSVDDLGVVEPGLLLFATFVLRGLAEEASAAAGAGASAAATSGS